MKGLVVQVLTSLSQRFWPPGPPPPAPNPEEGELRLEATRLEHEVRAELVRVQTDALRFRAMAGKD